MAGIGDLTILVSANIEAFQSAFQSVSQTLDKIGDQVEGLMDKFQGMGARMAAAGSVMSAAITAPLIGIGEGALDTAAKFEQTQIAFTHFIGSAQGAKDYLKQLYDFAANTPFQIQDITGGAQKLLAMGFAARDVVPMLRAMGDQLSAVGRMDMLPNLILAFGELKEGGVASMRALRQMVMDGVIPALKYMAEAAGVSAGDMRKQIMHGAVDTESALKTILAGMARDTGGLMASEMSSFSGMMTNVKDNITYTLNAIGQQLLPIAKNFAEFATSVLDQVKVIAQAFGNLPEPVRMFALALAGVAAVAGPLLVLIGGLTFGLAALNIAFAPIAGLIGISTAALGGYLAVAGVVIAAVAALAYETKKHWNSIKAVTVQAFEGISEMAHAIFGPVIEFLKNMFKPVGAAMVNVWTLVKGELSAIWNSIRADAEYIWGKVVSAFHMVVEAAKLIPGVNKLLTLDEAWRSAEKLSQSADKAAVSVHKMGTELKGLPKSGSTAAPETKVDFKPVTVNVKDIEAMAELIRMTNSFKSAFSGFKGGPSPFAPMMAGMTEAKQQITVGENEMAEGAAKMAQVMLTAGQRGAEGIDTIDKALKLISTAAVEPLTRITEAFKTLGVDSSRDLATQAADARAAYEAIKNSGVASAVDIQRAWVAMEEARIKAATAAGIAISKDELDEYNAAKKTIDELDPSKGGGKKDDKNDFFTSVNQSFEKSITAMLDGTKRFKNAWKSLGIDLLQSFGQTISELLAKWVLGMAKMLIVKVATDAGIVKSHASASAQMASIDIIQQIKNVFAAAKTAAANTWAAISAIPIVGPFLAPPAAAAAFAGVMALGAVSAEGGAVLPNYSTVGLLHPREMVLPAHISTGLQNMINSGGGIGGSTNNVSVHQTMNNRSVQKMGPRDLARHQTSMTKMAARVIRDHAFPRR